MNSTPYTVHIYESEATQISRWTLEYLNIETGGDLFGLWLNANEVVIQAAIGPGEKCRRTATSFFQDKQYLSKVGQSLTQDQGLCNVGSWHSHHTMNLPDPSRGDEDTVWKHLPTPGRFVLLIAAIKTETGAAKVQMGFNLFESTIEGNQMTPMKLNILEGESPIRANKAISSKVLEGAELHSKKMSYPERARNPKPEVNKRTRAEGQEVARPDMKSNAQYFDDGSSFSKNKRLKHRQRDPQGHRRRACDGVRMSYTFQLPYNTEIRHPRSRPHHHRIAKHNHHTYTQRVYDLPDGREGIILYHNDHPLGHCEDCCCTWAIQSRDGTLRVVHGRGEIDDCCSCSIL